MKIRLGFVSNSSSSSFTCDVSGCSESGMDMGLSEAGMSACAHGHTFYDQYRVEDTVLEELKESYRTGYSLDYRSYSQEDIDAATDEEQRKRKVAANERVHASYKSLHDAISAFEGNASDFIDMVDELGFEGRCGLPAAMCPICQLKNFQASTLLNYLLALHGARRDELETKLRKEFGTLKNLEAGIVSLLLETGA